ncbi:hypothetical protein KIN20_012009 [Parelaphostrongylus tenuis]|uniref:Uncharacterized protein n=1 Tax=Parelaphostrongylus tenuis TaxID=148309 RepID=A0AAD5MA93_PARTN|nr:hypothetical protein KIN20_012009 [Parelaphostrongylus tenuis]
MTITPTYLSIGSSIGRTPLITVTCPATRFRDHPNSASHTEVLRLRTILARLSRTIILLFCQHCQRTHNRNIDEPTILNDIDA